MPDQPGSLAAALVQLQANLPHVTKDAENPHFRSRYASLAAITDALLPALAAHGLSWTCAPTIWTDQFVLAYRLEHASSGEALAGWYPLPSSGTPQQIGSAITYARRYALSAVTGLVADDDDDGNAAEQAHAPQPASVGLDAAQREAAGMMTTGQRREHGKIAAMDKPARPADRANDPADDMWTGQPAGQWQDVTPEDKPGSSNGKQHQRLGILYRQIGIADPDQRKLDMTDRMSREITSAKDLSYREAERAIRELEDLAKREAAR